MKKTTILSAFLVLGNLLFAQTGYRTFSISAGLSSTNSKYACITLENSNNKKIHTGLMYQALFYSNFDPKKIDLKSGETYHSLGFFLSSVLSSSRNHDAQFYFGGAVGTNFSRLIYYPFIGLSQSAFVSPKVQLFLSERVSYLINLTDAQNWQPALSGGLKFLL